jgi:hypothetical protein
MEESRVILANEPKLLRGMLRRALGRSPGLQVVSEVPEPAHLGPMFDGSDVQWLVTPIWPEARIPRVLRSMLAQYSSLKILGIAVDGSRARVVGGKSREETWDEPSLDDLVSIFSAPVIDGQ